jgi:uncharacterized protein (TIGR02145 family)
MASRKIIWFFILSTLSVSLYRCKPEEVILHGEISGTVTDAVTNQPLQAATVKLIATNDTQSTGSNGKYIFKSLAPGNYDIEALKQGYSKISKTAAVTSANTTDISFALDAIPVIHFSTTILDFGLYLTSLSFTISRTGSGEVAYIFTPSKDWITVNPKSGEMNNETDTIKVTIHRGSLTKPLINEWIVMKATYLTYDYWDTINVDIKVHNEINFNPDLSYGTVTDIEGNVYKTIKIGTQTWMAENLKTTKYNDNSPIPLVTDSITWSRLSTHAYCWCKNDTNYKKIYGALYNRYTINNGNMCPTGWHIPTDSECTTLVSHVGGFTVDASAKLRETGTAHWISPNAGATNETGFTALPAGERWSGHGEFYDMGSIMNFWCAESGSANALYITNFASDPNACGFENLDSRNGCSVRCVKD